MILIDIDKFYSTYRYSYIYIYITTVMEAEYKPEIESTKDTPYLALMRELWWVFCENFGETAPHRTHQWTSSYELCWFIQSWTHCNKIVSVHFVTSSFSMMFVLHCQSLVTIFARSCSKLYKCLFKTYMLYFLQRLTESFSMYEIIGEMRRQRPSIVQAKVKKEKKYIFTDNNIYSCQPHGPLARYAKLQVRMRRECRERFPRHRR